MSCLEDPVGDASLPLKQAYAIGSPVSSSRGARARPGKAPDAKRPRRLGEGGGRAARAIVVAASLHLAHPLAARSLSDYSHQLRRIARAHEHATAIPVDLGTFLGNERELTRYTI